ncbi:variable surface protein Vir12 [Plasmodium vivax India VII]|uniref:Variable surface protein Vir12 n=1 Tax=Plasmodium vivax India VII TaxID=1077284 RepID=A0A0J9V6Z6_PLAVI|nr:variable surface protein Vir12 [Plasmodium vivax India VII]
MEDKIVEKALELLKTDDKISTQNKLHLVYEKFEKNPSLNTSNICKKEDNGHSTILKNDNEIVTLCIKVESILNNLNSICSTNNGHSGNKCCDYLIYWIYGELIKGNYTPYSVHWLYRKLQELLKRNQYGNNTSLKCNGNFKRVFGIENLDKRKHFHELLEYFDAIKGILKSEKHVKKDYCYYIYYIMQLYKNMKEACYSRIPGACPDEIKLFHHKIKGDDLNDVKDKCPYFSQKFSLSNMNAILDQLKKEQIMDVEIVEEPFKYRKLINYDIFHYLKIYQKAEPSAQDKENSVSNETNQCTEMKNYVQDKLTELEKICKDSILYFFKLSKTVVNSIHYFDYLNYWLNKNLKGTGISATKFIGIMDKILSSKFSSNSLYKHFKHSVYDMNDQILKEMNILYDLYDDYNKFLEISETKCTMYNNECLSTFVTEINKCDNIKNKKFYKALTNILSIYDKKYQEKCANKRSSELSQICKTLEELKTDMNEQNCIPSCKKINNMDLKTLHKEAHETVLNGLTAHEQYKKLDIQAVEESTCSNYCEDLIYMDGKEEEFNLLCAKMATNLEKLSTVLNGVTSHDRCTYFIFWAYEKIKNILNKNLSNHSNYYAINLLNQVLYSINKKLSLSEKCPYYVDGALSDWEKEKYLHDYFKNFEVLEKNVGKNHDNCGTYLGYLNHIKELYMNDLKSCCAYYTNSKPHYIEMCPKYFKCDKKYFPHSLISKLNCGNEETNPNVDEVFKGLFVDHDVVTNRRSKSSKISHQMYIARSDMQMQYEESPPLERKKPPVERKKPPLERNKPPLERKPPPKKKSPRNERIRIAYASNN